MSGEGGGPVDPLDLAARLLARARTRAELVRCLEARGVDPDRARQTAEECQSRGWLDEAQYARDWLERELRRSPSGPRRLRAALLQRGVPPAVAEAALREALALRPEEELARVVLARWLRARGPSQLARAPATGGAAVTGAIAAGATGGAAAAVQARSLAGFLARRGFDPEIVRRLVEEALGGAREP